MLDQRYRYDARGEYARDYSQRPAHPANIGLRLAISYGLEVHGELAGRKFNDVTLENALGAGAASLLWDGVEFDELALMAGVGRAQSYRDALRATFERIQELRVLDTDSSFIEEFCGQLEAQVA